MQRNLVKLHISNLIHSGSSDLYVGENATGEIHFQKLEYSEREILIRLDQGFYTVCIIENDTNILKGLVCHYCVYSFLCELVITAVQIFD